MTGTTKNFIINFLAIHPITGKVLDVGSRNVNGTVKDVLVEHGLKYTGLDMVDCGEFTDIVANAHDIKKVLKKESFDLVTCFDTLEHDDKFWLTVENMKWVLKKGGWMVIVVPSVHCPLHEWPEDYYRFLPEILPKVFFEGFDNCYFESVGTIPNPDAICGWGQK